MGVYSTDEIQKIIKSNRNVPDWIEKARKYSEDLNALINGIKFEELLEKIEGIEKSEKRAESRKKYSKSIMDLNKRLLRPIDNVYSATGGNKLYNIKDETTLNDVLKNISRIRGNRSLEKWLQKTWMSVYHTDPNGLIFMEYKSEPKLKVYPTYKSINSIRCYEERDQKLEWVLFEPIKKEIELNPDNENINEKFDQKTKSKKIIEIWRFVDDKNDYKIKIEGETITIIDEETFEHPFGETPGIINSDIPLIGTPNKLSPLHETIDLQKDYLRDKSILTIYKFQKGFPIFWRYKALCPDCHGARKKGNEKCPTCDGDGWLKDRDVTDEVLLPYPEDETDIVVNPIAGFISPEMDTWNQYTEDLNNNEIKQYETQWGSHFLEEDEKTATAKWINTQPVINKLNDYSDIAEYMEWQTSEWIVNAHMPIKEKNEKVCTITYGRRYIIESADNILKKYIEAKNNGVDDTILDRLMTEYITSKYKNDPEGLKMYLTKKDLTLYLHFNIDQVKNIFGTREAQRKMLFNDWWETLDFNKVKKSKKEKLEEDRDSWIDEKLIKLGIKKEEKIQDDINENLNNPDENKKEENIDK